MKKILFAIIACAFGCLTANAQSDDTVGYPHGFVGIRGGAHSLFLQENDGDRIISPSFGFNVGLMFNPYLGARVDAQGIDHKFNTLEGKESVRSMTYDVDALFNLTNCFRSNKEAAFNLYLLGGVGCIATWNEKPLQDWYNYRAGLMADVRLSRITSLNLEIDGNYNGGSNTELYGKGKWKVGAYLGVAFRIPFSDEDTYTPASALAPVTSNADYEAAQARAAAEAEAQAAAAKKAREAELARKAAAERAATAAAAKKAEVEPINETIFFTIGKTDKAEKWDQVVEAAAAWCKKYPEKTLNVAGYADKGTGTAKINARVAEKRATAVANAIKAKGIAADQLSVSSYGDKQQPYAENDQNRCVIVAGK